MKFTVSNPLAWIDEQLAALGEQGLLRELGTHVGACKVRITVAGRELINFGSNDYLGLAGDARIVAAAAQAMASEGWGAGASPLVTGHTSAQVSLESRLAEFEETEAALVFASGYAANMGTIAALVEQGDQVFADELNHASMIDGCRLSRAEIKAYPHGDWRALETLLVQTPTTGRRLIATESIFSMDGDAAPLVELADLAERHNCMLLVDEAHATGVFGAGGRGMCEELGVADRVAIRIGTLSKALASVGGFAVGSRSLIDWLANRARPFVFSTALPPAACAAAQAALAIVQAEPERRRELMENSRDLAARLRAQGWTVGETVSPIIPILVGQPQAAAALAEYLQTLGILAPAIRPPSVPRDQARLRISLTAGHSAAMIEQLLAALNSARQQNF